MNNDLIDKIERLPHSFNYDEFGHNSEIARIIAERITEKVIDIIQGADELPRVVCGCALCAKYSCSQCGQKMDKGRRLFTTNNTILCGDCIARGTPLHMQPVKPEPPRKGAWMTATWDENS